MRSSGWNTIAAAAMTVLDILMRPEIAEKAWDYFKNVQTKDRKYTPLIRPSDVPAIWLNEEIMAKYRPEMRKYYYDPTKYKTYLEQLGMPFRIILHRESCRALSEMRCRTAGQRGRGPGIDQMRELRPRLDPGVQRCAPARCRRRRVPGLPRRRFLHPQGLRSQSRAHSRHHRRAD